MSTPVTANMPATSTPDRTAALRAWQNAFQKRDADSMFRSALDPLARQIRSLLAQAPTGGELLTISAVHQMPQPARDFYAKLIDVAEVLADLMEDHLPDNLQSRHAALALIGDALGAFRNATALAMIATCGCQTCEQAVKERSPGTQTEGPRPMNRLIYPRTATVIADTTRMALAAYAAVPNRAAAHGLHKSIHDMWGFTYFALRNVDGPQWDELGRDILATCKAIGAAGNAPDVEPPTVIEAVTRIIERFGETAGITRPETASASVGDHG
ncbi:hypothetical protein AB0942_28505 [Streptomyces nodosus]|uniref:hypothetical protein n=1 Tax=Streptomyces nodosus TaxID=40318 RepID=UPI003452BC92